MHTRIRHVTIDCHDPYRLAQFWAGILGYTDDPDNPNAADDPEALIIDPRGLHPGLLFIPVPEHKTVKNRIHLDLVPDAARDVAVDRALGLGATLVADHRRPDGSGWAVLADPEGNEFCLERSAAERGSAPPAATGDRPYPEGIRTADEAEQLAGMLDWYRAAVVLKVAGASTRTVRATPVVSGTTIAGLLKHLALVEDSWFHHRFAGNPEPEPWASAPWDDDRDWEFHSAADDDLNELVALYEAACARSRQAAAGRSLDDVAAASDRPFTLRFAYVHLLEETARHAGHLDILRELLDGTTGE
jgi:hypothetical protein